MLAYPEGQDSKNEILSQLAAYRQGGRLIKGTYWDKGKGCAVGCTIHSSNFAEYERRFGIPQMLGHFKSRIFEGLPKDKFELWPERFMAAFKPGYNYSLTGWKFLYWELTDSTINPGIENVLVRDAVKLCAQAVLCLAMGLTITDSPARSAANAARSTARFAEKAVKEAESSASMVWRLESRAALNAICSAIDAAVSVTDALDALGADALMPKEGRAAAASRSAANAGRSMASTVKSSPDNSAFAKMADKLIELIEATP